MVDKIYQMKNEFIMRIDKDIRERGIDRIDVKEMGELVDMVKDLAEAECACMKAEYYKTVTAAMNQGSGYGGVGGTDSRAGYGQSGYGSMRSGYGNGMDRQGYSGSMGHQDIKEVLTMSMQNATPEEREHIRNEVNMLMGSMR